MSAVAGPAAPSATAVPIPSPTASAPTRPTYIGRLNFSILNIALSMKISPHRCCGAQRSAEEFPFGFSRPYRAIAHCLDLSALTPRD